MPYCLFLKRKFSKVSLKQLEAILLRILSQNIHRWRQDKIPGSISISLMVVQICNSLAYHLCSFPTLAMILFVILTIKYCSRALYTERLHPSKIHMLKPNPHWMTIGCEAFQGWWGHEGRAPMNDIGDLIKERQKAPLPPSIMWGQGKKTAIYE